MIYWFTVHRKGLVNLETHTTILSNVKLLQYNDGSQVDLNDNEVFMDKLEDIVIESVANVRLEEYFDNYIELYRMRDNKYIMYFTVVHDDLADGVDGYIIESDDVVLLFAQVAVARDSFNGRDIKEMLDYAYRTEVIA